MLIVLFRMLFGLKTFQYVSINTCYTCLYLIMFGQLKIGSFLPSSLSQLSKSYSWNTFRRHESRKKYSRNCCFVLILPIKCQRFKMHWILCCTLKKKIKKKPKQNTEFFIGIDLIDTRDSLILSINNNNSIT